MRRVPSRNRVVMKKQPESRPAYRTLGSFSSFAKPPAPLLDPREKFLLTGAQHKVFTHAVHGFPLASEQLIQPVVAEDLCCAMLGINNDIALSDIMQFKAVVETSKTRGRFGSKLRNQFHQAMVSLGDGKLRILGVNSKGKKSKNTSKQSVLNTLSNTRRNSASSSLSTKSRSGLQAPGSPRSPRPSKADRGSLYSNFDEEGGAIEFALSHLYDINYARSGSRELVLSFFYPRDDAVAPPTTEYQLVHLTLKAESSDKAVAWLKNILSGAGSIAQLVSSFAAQEIKDQKRIASQGFEQDPTSVTRALNFLRLSVDIWSLARGYKSKEVARAQVLLGDYLKEQGDEENEAEFWYTESESILASIEESKEEQPQSMMELYRKEVSESGIV